VPYAAVIVASLSLAIWLYLAAARGQFWRVHDFDDDAARHEPPPSWPNVVTIVPARNETLTIRQCVTSLLQQNYPGQFSVIVVDDHSEDATAETAKQAARNLQAEARFTVLEASPLPAGWTGKLWALHCGTATLDCAPTTSISLGPQTTSRTDGIHSCAPNLTPTYFWFTDADIIHAPDTLHRLVARAEHDHLDLTSLMVLLQAKTFPERALIPAFLFFFLKLYPPSWIANSKARTAGAAGGCILLCAEALQRIGGFAAIRNEVIDDCALARAVKVAQPSPERVGQPLMAVVRRSLRRNTHPPVPDQPTPLWMGLTRSSISLRSYSTFAEIRDLIARTAYTQLRYRPLLLLATVAAMFLIYVAPMMLLFASETAPRLLAASTWLLMSLLYIPTIRFYRLSPAWAVTLPFAALFYSYATLLSVLRYYLGRGAQWKGRTQATPNV
jgi:hopene-associated glycosyltransferase HpnB